VPTDDTIDDPLASADLVKCGTFRDSEVARDTIRVGKVLWDEIRKERDDLRARVAELERENAGLVAALTVARDNAFDSWGVEVIRKLKAAKR
jgi:hypothetical protein